MVTDLDLVRGEFAGAEAATIFTDASGTGFGGRLGPNRGARLGRPSTASQRGSETTPERFVIRDAVLKRVFGQAFRGAAAGGRSVQPQQKALKLLLLLVAWERAGFTNRLRLLIGELQLVGISMEAIKEHGRWKSEAVQLYVRKSVAVRRAAMDKM
ncbi:protein ubiquitination [Pleodorina starrii]|uniref:Protein ubiquitination n=1 Tax=Pleodorina starrii TaxID=330485 RepID=A0A9W6BNW7_9CHLO|nr:protein ubiquitination [Pleodorina starrii]